MASHSSSSVLLFILGALVVTTAVLLQPVLAADHLQYVSATASRSTISARSAASSTSAAVIEHPVFFNMADLTDNPENESSILQGLNDLVYNNYSDLYFLFSGRVLESKGVPFTHALISRFPSLEALQIYYDYAIKDIASQMGPWLKKEYCVDYVVDMEEDAIMLDVTSDLATHVTFIKVSSNVSDSDIKGAMDAFLGLAQETDYAIQLTCGENLYVKEGYRTMSHAFSAYFPSVAAMERWQQDTSVVSVVQGTIWAMADSYAMVSLVPFVSTSMMI